jgi:hypothetical protein
MNKMKNQVQTLDPSHTDKILYAHTTRFDIMAFFSNISND